MNRPATFARQGRIGALCIDNPPVNALSPQTVAALRDSIAEFEAADDVDALVLYCAGRTFVAGGDIAAFEDPAFSAAPYNALLARIEASRRPVVAAVHGTALGGGLELALACHHRVAQPSARLGLPEVKIGLLPGSLGTQRLPRLVGAPLALDLITTGRVIGAQQAMRGRAGRRTEGWRAARDRHRCRAGAARGGLRAEAHQRTSGAAGG